ncbi:MAG: type II toxin-antitoxin system Phd/YefM family antitoxin [Sulfuricella sp.]
MQLVNIHEAKTQLSKLLEQVQAGEDVVIAKAGTPIVRLIPYAPPRRRIAPPGAMEGEGWIADDFDEPIDKLFDCLKDPTE